MLGPCRVGLGVAAAMLAAVVWSPASDGHPRDGAGHHGHWHKGKDRGDYAWWRVTRARRLAELDVYITANADDFESFRSAPLGIKQEVLNFVGIQMIMVMILSALTRRFFRFNVMAALMALARDWTRPRFMRSFSNISDAA